MWAKDVGREAGAGKPLLKTIFQARPLARGSPKNPETLYHET